jgi:Tol biopolymer transport system component
MPASSIWIKDLPSGPVQKLTLEGDSFTPSWSADGRTVFFLSQRDSRPVALYQRRADGSTNASLVLGHGTPMVNAVVSRDGAWVVFAAGGDIFARRTSGDTAVARIVAGPSVEASPALSPDGRWLAYLSFESGGAEVYVSPFPDASTSRTIVSVGGARDPVWAPSGRELFYRQTDQEGSLIAAQVELAPSFRVRERVPLFKWGSFVKTGFGGAYAVTPDGQRFVVQRPLMVQDQRLVLELNWLAELKGRVAR